MNKRPAKLKIRIEYEPNRFSSEHVISVYERLKPIVSSTASEGQQRKEAPMRKPASEGGKQ